MRHQQQRRRGKGILFSAADKFIMESSSTGEISNITMSQTYKESATMFGVENGVQSSLFSRMYSDQSVNFNAIVENLNSGRDQSLHSR